MRWLKDLKTSRHFLKYHKFIEHRDNFFRITYNNHEVDDTLRDIDKYKAEILKDGLWVKIADITDIEFYPISQKSDNPEKHKDSNKFFELMKDHIALIW